MHVFNEYVTHYLLSQWTTWAQNSNTVYTVHIAVLHVHSKQVNKSDIMDLHTLNVTYQTSAFPAFLTVVWP